MAVCSEVVLVCGVVLAVLYEVGRIVLVTEFVAVLVVVVGIILFVLVEGCVLVAAEVVIDVDFVA